MHVERVGLTGVERLVLAGILLSTIAIIWSPFRLPMYDASSHIATAVVAERLLDGDVFTRAHTTIDLVPVPYWLTTLGLLALSWAGPFAGIKILFTIHALLVPLAFHQLARIAFPAAVRWTPLVALTVFGLNYWSGETNFVLGQPWVLLGVGAYLRARRVRSAAFAAFVACAIVAYAAHVFVISALLGALLSLTFISHASSRARSIPGAPEFGRAQAAALALAALLFGVAAYFVLSHHGTSANQGTLLFDLSPKRIGNIFEEPLSSPTILSPGPALLLAVGIAALWLVSRARDRERAGGARLLAGLHLPFLLTGLAFAALVYFGPTGLLEEGGRNEEDICQRFGFAAFAFLLLGIRLELSTWGRRARLVLVVAMACLKLADARSLHARVGAAHEEIAHAIFSHIPEESRVLPINDVREANARRWTYFFLYEGNYAVVDRRAYVPTLFARAGQQPLRHVFFGEHRYIFDRKIEASDWDFYDFILVQTKSDRPSIEGLHERAEEIAAASGFRLYRIARPFSWGDPESAERAKGTGRGFGNRGARSGRSPRATMRRACSAIDTTSKRSTRRSRNAAARFSFTSPGRLIAGKNASSFTSSPPRKSKG